MGGQIVFYGVVLAIINFPFVIFIERHIQTRPVKPVFRLEVPDGQRSREIRNSYCTTPVHALLYLGFVGPGILKTRSESVPLALGTFLLTLLWTEAWHYASHVTLHMKEFHFIHREHHLSRVTAPWTSVSFSILEKVIFSTGILVPLAIFSRVYPLSAFGIFAYYVVYFYTNTLGHANFEFRKPGYYGRVMGKIFNTPSYHALHHARYKKNYGLLTPWFDRMFGTEWADVKEVQTRAALGEPLLKLTERCGGEGGSLDRP
jgi:sterol desaturase/sphingolipid hydroxylase (fatty acid hydroxylase superfamily)